MKFCLNVYIIKYKKLQKFNSVITLVLVYLILNNFEQEALSNVFTVSVNSHSNSSHNLIYFIYFVLIYTKRVKKLIF